MKFYKQRRSHWRTSGLVRVERWILRNLRPRARAIRNRCAVRGFNLWLAVS